MIFQIGDKVNFRKKFHNAFSPFDNEVIPCIVTDRRSTCPFTGFVYDVEPVNECGILSHHFFYLRQQHLSLKEN